MLGLTRDEIINACQLAGSMVSRCDNALVGYTPNTGSRQEQAAGDATSRAVRLALIAKTGRWGIRPVLSAKTGAFYDVLFKGNEFKFHSPRTAVTCGTHPVQDPSFPQEFIRRLRVSKRR